MFTTPWAYVDHVLLAPGTTSPAKAHDTVGEAYYVIAGSGRVTSAPKLRPLGRRDDPAPPGETSTIVNAGSEPLELLVIGVAKDFEAKMALILASAPRRP